MQRLLTTPQYEGHFDFFSNLVVLNCYEARHLREIQDALAWTAAVGTPTQQAIDIRALLKHELTHFLDMTTTGWGAQYILRKLRMVRTLGRTDEEAEQARSVFMLETSEIELHREMLYVGEVHPQDCNILQHGLRYTERFGAVLMIFYVRGDMIRHEVPLSMLSLLEANATASEYLSRLQDAESIEDGAVQMLVKEDIGLCFDALLNDPERLEYSVLLNLARVHFRQLSLRELLVLVAALCRFALDATSMGMSAMANRIERSAVNVVLGRSIAMELRRAANRPLIYFKSVLFLHGWLNEMTSSEAELCLELIRSNPRDVIYSLWRDRLGVDGFVLDLGRDFTPVMMQELMNGVKVLADASVFEQSYAANSTKLDRMSAGLVPFSDLKVLDVVLGDDSVLEMPQRIPLPVLDYFNENLQTFTALDKAYRNEPQRRFHIPLDAVDIHLPRVWPQTGLD